MPTTTARPRAPRQPIAVAMPAAVPETSNATSAPAPSVQSSTQAAASAASGSTATRPSELDDLAGDARSARRRRPRPRPSARRSRSAGRSARLRRRRRARRRRARSGARRAPRPRSARPARPSAATGRRAGGRARPPARSSATASSPGASMPEEDQPVADVRGAARARGAVAARDERHDGRRVADRPALDAVADRRDAAGHLVAEHGRHRHARVHRAVEDVEVGAADPGVGDLELHLARRRRRRLGVDHLERAVADVASGIHMMSIYIRSTDLKDQTNLRIVADMPTLCPDTPELSGDQSDQ